MNTRVGRSSWRTTLIFIFYMMFMACLTGCGENAGNDASGVNSPTNSARIVNMTAERAGLLSASLFAGQTTVITVTVEDGSGNPAPMGETVTFTIPVNTSGASLSTSPCIPQTLTCGCATVQATTDAGGNAVAIYVAGDNDEHKTVYDTVRAVLTNGSSNAVAITRFSWSAGLSISVAAAPVSVFAGQVSIITATLTGGDYAGATVTFSIPTNSSGARLTSYTAITDGAGKAVVTYWPGIQNPSASVQDVVQAAVGTATSAVVITRVGGPSIWAVNIDLEPAPTTVPVAGGSSVITATVTNNTGTVVSGVTVDFSTVGGAVSPASATTDASGKAVTTFTAGAGAAGTAAGVVTASVTSGGNTYATAVNITH